MNKLSSITIILLGLTISCFSQSAKNESNELKMKQVESISKLHKVDSPVSAKVLFKGSEGTTRALQINKDGLLKEHITETEALLVCVIGEVKYEDEKNNSCVIKSGEYITIEPKVKHWVTGLENSQLLLIK